MFDEKFFVALAFVMFVALVFKAGKKFILSTVDARILKIKSELEEATRLKNEASALLVKYEKEQSHSLERSGAYYQGSERSAGIRVN